MCVLVLALSVGVLVGFGGRRLLQEGGEGGADGATPERLLHAEVVHHALLYLLFSRGEQEATEDRQLKGGAKRNKVLKTTSQRNLDNHTVHTNYQKCA